MKKRNIVLGLAVVAALNVASFQPASAGSNPFATVPQSTGYYQDVAALVHDGLIDGYADSDFKANRPLTRYEMAVFTAKAMSNSNKANAADTQRIQKLMKAFQSELTDMHVAIPGVKAKNAKKAEKPAKAKFTVPDGWKLSGMLRYRLDGGTKKNPDGSKKTGADGFGGAKNHQLLWQYNNKFSMGGGWQAELDLIGARDGNGDSRTTGENTVGYATANKIFAQGPLFGGRARIGKTKGSFIGIKKSLIMGQYYTGGDYMYAVSPKWKIGGADKNLDFDNDQKEVRTCIPMMIGSGPSGSTSNTTKAQPQSYGSSA
ncbi:MAG: S-layer homology domain-containing protein, partial [Selenomonadaceae bacterium]|nr:S-layer homology domain-containing protein [Selenomonadaceae bacterium]